MGDKFHLSRHLKRDSFRTKHTESILFLRKEPTDQGFLKFSNINDVTKRTTLQSVKIIDYSTQPCFLDYGP